MSATSSDAIRHQQIESMLAAKSYIPAITELSKSPNSATDSESDSIDQFNSHTSTNNRKIGINRPAAKSNAAKVFNQLKQPTSTAPAFTKEIVHKPASMSGSVISPLTTQLANLRGSLPSVNGINQSIATAKNGSIIGSHSIMKCRVYLPNNDSVNLELNHDTATAGILIELTLHAYRRIQSNGLLPISFSNVPTDYRVYVAEEDGDVDTDFPALDCDCILSTTGVDLFALRLKRDTILDNNNTDQQSSQSPSNSKSQYQPQPLSAPRVSIIALEQISVNSNNHQSQSQSQSPKSQQQQQPSSPSQAPPATATAAARSLSLDSNPSPQSSNNNNNKPNRIKNLFCCIPQ